MGCPSVQKRAGGEALKRAVMLPHQTMFMIILNADLLCLLFI
jgi:hypothetical protein